jgi:hypothetical protein
MQHAKAELVKKRQMEAFEDGLLSISLGAQVLRADTTKSERARERDGERVGMRSSERASERERERVRERARERERESARERDLRGGVQCLGLLASSVAARDTCALFIIVF